MSKILIAYFSRRGQNYVNGLIKELAVGNTEVAAGMIQEAVGGDLFYIQPVKEYNADYNKSTKEAMADLKANARPLFKDPPANLDGYDTVYLCYPNYWGTMPMHVFTFLERYDFSGKTIKPLCTHEGSGLGHSISDIKELCPHAVIEEGLALHGASIRQAKPAIEAWV